MKKKIIVIAVILLLTITSYLLYTKYENNISNNNNSKVDTQQIITNNLTNSILKDNDLHTENNKIEYIGYLEIPKIKLNGPIMEGSTSSILKNYIGHIEETSLYNGNIGLAAHNRGNKYSYFAKLNELEKGDELIYKTKFGESKYIVDIIKEINEEDWSLLENTSEDKLTLITCIKNKRNYRLCVQGSKKNI